ncbi:MAG: DUF1016 N-terminal domain-containing protein [Candidatus Omnitrophica bacterium]|nr:DUF1016 N-terminal domain-containing protein [Candidatus Omnitrophota bacterium]
MQVQTYDELLVAIRQARQAGQVRVEQSKVREAWETGKLIDEHVLQHKERAEYGARVIERLAKDLGSSRTELGYMLAFARAYPICPTSGELTWSDYRELLSLKDAGKRAEVSEKAAREKWDTKRIRSEVKRLNQLARTGVEPTERLTAKPGILHAYRVVPGLEEGELLLDLGFSNYYKPTSKIPFQEKDILEIVWGGEYKKLKNVTEDVLFTYEIQVLDVIDGDTIAAVIDLGFGFRTVQKLRLRGIDAPEIATADGVEAQNALEEMLEKTKKPILIRTVKSDKYDRYLADVFVDSTYVNQKLVDGGYAVIVEA